MFRKEVYRASESDEIKTIHWSDYGKSFHSKYKPLVEAAAESSTYETEKLDVSV